MHKIHTCCVCVDRWSFVENNSLSLQKTTQNVLLTSTMYDGHQISTISLTTYHLIHVLMHIFNEYFKPQNVAIITTIKNERMNSTIQEALYYLVIKYQILENYFD